MTATQSTRLGQWIEPQGVRAANRVANLITAT